MKIIVSFPWTVQYFIIQNENLYSLDSLSPFRLLLPLTKISIESFI